MSDKIKSFFYNFDFTGVIPQFRILKEDSYKSIPSTFISIIIIISSITFTIYSIIEFFKFENPSISYIKSYDTEYNKFILLKDTLFMFDASVFCLDNVDFTTQFSARYQESSQTKDLNLERCEVGKNIDIKFRDLLEKEGLKDRINQYFCISSEHGDLPLYYRPGKSPEKQTLISIYIFNIGICSNIMTTISLITENDIVQYNKNNPIVTSLNVESKLYEGNEIPQINYRFEIQRYESDNGYFFQNPKNYIAVGISEISYEKNNFNNCFITFGSSNKPYSHYKRRYQKIQSLLADTMSIINILIGIGKEISKFLLRKKMNKDIVRNLINRNIYAKIKECSIIEKNKKEKNLFKNINEKSKNLDGKEINIKEKLNEDNSNNLFKIKSENDLYFEKSLEKIVNKKKFPKITIFKKINFLDIIKSYFCFKGKKIKLIDICDKLVMEDLCLERILGRLYGLEKLFSLISKKKLSKLNLQMNTKFRRISYYINDIKNIESKVKKKNKNKNHKKKIDKNKNDNNILNKK